jgi:hypothetical protein
MSMQEIPNYDLPGKWFENLLKGSDQELVEATTQMDGAVNELNQAVGLASFTAVDALSEVFHSLE